MNTFTSAEIGINHNGDIELCKKLIDVAVNSGFKSVKFQKRDINTVYTSEYLNSLRESPWGKTQRDQKKALEFSLDQYKIINKYCNEKSIEWYASAWDKNSIKFLDNFDCKYNKVASAMIVDLKFLEEVADRKKYTFISTGMSDYNIIDEAVNLFEKKSCPYELMHTVSTYPMEDKDANISLIPVLKKRYKCNVGYSGHETGVLISVAAVVLGASSIERHITLNRAMYGSDQAASLEPNGCRDLIEKIKKIEACYGDGKKTFLEIEKPIAEKLRQHI